jgi:hypothetical protein
MKNELKVVTTVSMFTLATWDHAHQATINAGDIRCPWKSVYGFALIAAQLAANQALVLHCREDEAFDLMAKLNALLKRPEVLSRTYKLLKTLEQETRQKLARLTEMEEQPLTESEIPGLLEDTEQILVESSERTVASRLESILSPNKPVEEITGLSKMLVRLRVWISALKKIKDQGMHVVVYDRRRQPYRPALKARRNEPILQDGKQSTLTAGFLLPAKYHLTLWAYLVVRSDDGQSTIWN